MGLVMEAPRGLKGRVPYREFAGPTMADSSAFPRRRSPPNLPKSASFPKEFRFNHARQNTV